MVYNFRKSGFPSSSTATQSHGSQSPQSAFVLSRPSYAPPASHSSFLPSSRSSFVAPTPPPPSWRRLNDTQESSYVSSPTASNIDWQSALLTATQYLASTVYSAASTAVPLVFRGLQYLTQSTYTGIRNIWKKHPSFSLVTGTDDVRTSAATRADLDQQMARSTHSSATRSEVPTMKRAYSRSLLGRASDWWSSLTTQLPDLDRHDDSEVPIDTRWRDKLEKDAQGKKRPGAKYI